MLQIILLLIRNQVSPSPPRTDPEEDERGPEVDPEEYVHTRREKKRKKPRLESVAGTKTSTKKARHERRKNKVLRPPDADVEAAYRPEVALDMLADRIALWHAIGAGGGDTTSTKGGDGREFDADSESDEEGGVWVRPSRREVEEWDWAQRFCVNVVER